MVGRVMVTNETTYDSVVLIKDTGVIRGLSIDGKTELTTRCFRKTDKSWIDYRALTKICLSANINGPCNLMKEYLNVSKMCSHNMILRYLT